jgi:hypothetical protein
MSKKTFNGWKNRETWVVALWIDNTEADQTYWRERAREERDGHFYKEGAIALLAEDLRDTIGENSPISENNIYSDLLNGALENVDWREIAAHLIEGLK